MPARPTTEPLTKDVAGAPLGIAGRIKVYAQSFTGLSDNARRLLIATTLLWVGIGISGVLFNLYLIDIGYNVAFVGVLAAVSTVGQAAMSPVLGRVMRRWPAHKVIMAATALAAVTMAASAVFTGAFPLIVATALLGAAVASAAIPTSPFIMEQSTIARRGHLFAAYSAATTFGSMAGSLISGVMPAISGALPALGSRAITGDRAGLLLGAAITAIGVWSLWKVTDERVEEESVGRIPSAHSGKPEDEQETRRDVLAMMTASALIAISLGLVYPLFNVYFATVHHASTATIGVLYAMSGLFCTFAAFLGPVVARRGSLTGLVAVRTLSAPVMLIFWTHPGLALACAAYVGRGILGQVSGVLENTFAMETVPTRFRAAVSSWRTFSFNVGWTGGSLVAGVVVARYGFDVVFVASTILTLAGALAWYRRFGPRKSHPPIPSRPADPA